MTFFLFTIIFVAVCAFIVLKTSKKDEPKQPSQQPIHFDLLDDTGEPLSKEPIVKNLQYFCIKDKGYHVSVWPKDQGFQGIDYIEFNIAGITHGEHVDDHLGEFVANLEPEPTNPYDEKAIKIVTSEGHRVGYVPKDQTTYVRDFATLSCRCYCYIGTNDGMYFTDCYIKKESK